MSSLNPSHFDLSYDTVCPDVCIQRKDIVSLSFRIYYTAWITSIHLSANIRYLGQGFHLRLCLYLHLHHRGHHHRRHPRRWRRQHRHCRHRDPLWKNNNIFKINFWNSIKIMKLHLISFCIFYSNLTSDSVWKVVNGITFTMKLWKLFITLCSTKVYVM